MQGPKKWSFTNNLLLRTHFFPENCPFWDFHFVATYLFHYECYLLIFNRVIYRKLVFSHCKVPRVQKRTVNNTSNARGLNQWLLRKYLTYFRSVQVHSENQLCAKGKARDPTGAEVIALAAVLAVRWMCRGHIVCTPLPLLPIWLSIQKCYSLHSGPDSAT